MRWYFLPHREYHILASYNLLPTSSIIWITLSPPQHCIRWSAIFHIIAVYYSRPNNYFTSITYSLLISTKTLTNFNCQRKDFIFTINDSPSWSSSCSTIFLDCILRLWLLMIWNHWFVIYIIITFLISIALNDKLIWLKDSNYWDVNILYIQLYWILLGDNYMIILY